MQVIRHEKLELSSAQIFLGGFLAFCAFSSLVIASFPLQASIVTVFLFAGVHNFFEFRYFLARMPARWGRSRSFYAAGIGGVIVLTVSYLTVYLANDNWIWSTENSQAIVAAWNTAFVLWVGLLFYLRGRQKPKSDWTIAFAVAFLLAAVAWLIPHLWSLSLVYLHPLVALWFLERQIRRTRREWLGAYHICLAAIPFLLLILWLALAGAPQLTAGATAADNNLFWRITQHAGSEILPNFSSHLLVAAHVFLETIHYAVWIVLIPLVDRRAVPWKIKEIPLASDRYGFKKIVFAALAASLIFVMALWLGFATDYSTTRDVYFAFAIAHVLAEVPFLIKML
jgi:hypothetical protein